MIRIGAALAASGLLGAVGAYLVLADAYPHEGPWVSISRHHGIHVGDVVIVAIWGGATWGLLHWARTANTRAHG